MYTGLPQYIEVDEGLQLQRLFAQLSALHKIELQKYVVQSHNSLGIGERYHEPLRDTYRKLKLDHPSMQRQLLLASAVKAMNDTLGPEGVVPTALVLGEFPSLRSFEGTIVPRPTLAERVVVTQAARRLIAKHLAQTKVKQALNHNIPSATDNSFQPGNKILVWGEKLVENRIGELVGPYTVYSYDAEAPIVLVQKDKNSAYERYNLAQVRPLLKPDAATTDLLRTLYTSLSQFLPTMTPSPYTLQKYLTGTT